MYKVFPSHLTYTRRPNALVSFLLDFLKISNTVIICLAPDINW